MGARLAAAGLIVPAAALGWLFLAGGERKAGTRALVAAEAIPSPSAPGGGRAPEGAGPDVTSEFAAAARSLRDTDVDGGLATDAAGHFVPTREALALFDYFLSARGEVTDTAAHARVRAEIARRLAPPARDEALAFFDRYLAYRAEGRALSGDPHLAEAGDLERRLQWLRELRREHFGAEVAEALFGEEEAVLRVSLEQRRILADADLDPEEREARLADAEAELPERVQAARARARGPTEAWRAEREMRDAGASDAEIQAYRERTFGPEAAARLAELDRRRAAGGGS